MYYKSNCSSFRITTVIILRVLSFRMFTVVTYNISLQRVKRVLMAMAKWKDSGQLVHLHMDLVESTDTKVLNYYSLTDKFGSSLEGRVKRWSADLVVRGPIIAEGGNLFNHKRGCITHSISLSTSDRPDITKTLFKKCKISSYTPIQESSPIKLLFRSDQWSQCTQIVETTDLN